MIAALIWDVDGTLVDTAAHHFTAWQRFAQEIEKPFTRADFAATFGMRNPEILRRLFEPDADDDNWKSEVINPDACQECFACVENCPEEAITFED